MNEDIGVWIGRERVLLRKKWSVWRHQPDFSSLQDLVCMYLRLHVNPIKSIWDHN